MTEHGRKILVCVAWPYANGEKHIGQIAGAYLPPDIFARYQRMAGNDVLMVSGSDTHGTPITLQAEREGLGAAEVVDKYHELFVEGCVAMGLTFDLYTHTDTQNHWDVTQQVFRRHMANEYIYREVQEQWYDPEAGRFLADRYVEGTCPFCGFAEARGDQCDNCGRLYDALELTDTRSKLSGSSELEVRETEHFFLDLGALNEPLLEWIGSDKEHWRNNVLNFTQGQLNLKELRGRAITRDIDWGIDIPLEGYESKRIYVWYDAVQGYLSAAIEWAALSGGKWQDWWDRDLSPDARHYYFIGKDNIPFHTQIWPGMIMAYNDETEAEGEAANISGLSETAAPLKKARLHLPYDVPANEYLNFGGAQFSTSRGNVIGFNTVLEEFEADAWRYTLTAMAPETADTEFTWPDFVELVNNELVANWGNLVNRALGFAFRRYEGAVPEPGELDATDEALLAEIRGGFESVGALYEAVRLKAALQEARRLSQRVNQYLNEKEPWRTFQTDPETTATTVYVTLQAIDWLKLLWAPILPHSSEQLHQYLGYSEPLFGQLGMTDIEDDRGSHLVLRYDHGSACGVWQGQALAVGQHLRKPAPLFTKLDPAVVLGEENE
ncbi:MAG: methionine--tRNA ligase [Caldilineaceae bacterium SB0668_bin_21]|nr:methionine--tRNA ligase [Caldilineaceae bacterium SB0668_bin_21]MYC22293.1 methionine--tRNA ligase [Caldilineaceae bacterium SB0662_bin_25]